MGAARLPAPLLGGVVVVEGDDDVVLAVFEPARDSC